MMLGGRMRLERPGVKAPCGVAVAGLISGSGVPLYYMAVSRHKRTRAKPRAATADELGADAPKKRIPSKWRKYYDRMVAHRDLLLNRQEGMRKEVALEPHTFRRHI